MCVFMLCVYMCAFHVVLFMDVFQYLVCENPVICQMPAFASFYLYVAKLKPDRRFSTTKTSRLYEIPLLVYEMKKRPSSKYILSTP